MAEICSSKADNARVQEFYVDHKLYAGRPGVADFRMHKLTDTALEADGKALEVASRNRLISDSEFQIEAAASHGVRSFLCISACFRIL